jgi:hypothetical protein
MNKLAYLILGILVERYHQYLKYPQHITSEWCELSTIWIQVEKLYHSASFDEMDTALRELVEEGLIEKQGRYLYCFCVVRKSAAA